MRSRGLLPKLYTITACLCYSINGAASAFCIDGLCVSQHAGWSARLQQTIHPPPLAALMASGIESLDTCSSRTGLPPVLQDMIKERKEYELKLGKAMDTLQTDYPQLLTKSPGKYAPAGVNFSRPLPHFENGWQQSLT